MHSPARILKPHRRLHPLALLVAAVGLVCPSSRAEIEPAARALADEVAAKLGAAQTLRLTATHRIDPALGVGSRLEKGPLTITVKRPNRFHAIQQAGPETREIAYDGKTLCLMHPELKHHALESLRAGSVAQFADRVDERFGFRPPVAELLSADFATQLFRHVSTAKVTGTEWVGWTACERLHFEQDGMTGDLWVGKKDRLPRRYRLTFTDVAGSPAWDIRLKSWELGVSVDESLFTKRPPADSHKVPLLKSR
jgi:hypothetical protein